MTIILLRDIACPLGSFKAGHEVELPKEMAAALLEAGFAKVKKTPVAEEPALEAETADDKKKLGREMAISPKGGVRKGK